MSDAPKAAHKVYWLSLNSFRLYWTFRSRSASRFRSTFHGSRCGNNG